MSPIYSLVIFSLTALTGYLFSLSPFIDYLPQLTALLTIIFILFIKKQKSPLYLISLIVNLLVFATNGLSSPVFFLTYFLLFAIAFRYSPRFTLAYSLVQILLLSQSLNSLISLLPLFSLILISPIAWLIGLQRQENQRLHTDISTDETDIFLWFSLKFKNSLSSILDSLSILQSDPRLSPSQKQHLQQIKKTSRSLLNSAVKLTQKIDTQTDET